MHHGFYHNEISPGKASFNIFKSQQIYLHFIIIKILKLVIKMQQSPVIINPSLKVYLSKYVVFSPHPSAFIVRDLIFKKSET